MGQANTIEEIEKHGKIEFNALLAALEQNKKSLVRCIKKLERDGLISVQYQKGNHTGRPRWTEATITLSLNDGKR